MESEVVRNVPSFNALFDEQRQLVVIFRIPAGRDRRCFETARLGLRCNDLNYQTNDAKIAPRLPKKTANRHTPAASP